MMNGWIKLYRKSIDSEAFRNPNLWKVWCYCLMRATHKDTRFKFNGKSISLQSGQFITGRFEGAKDCKMRPSTFRNQLSKLKAGGNLDIKSDNKKSIITIVNWASYQGDEEKKDSTSVEIRTQTRIKNKLIELARSLITDTKKESSVYSIVTKYKNTLGEDKVRGILADLLKNDKKFENENRLAAYLQTCKDRNGQLTDALPEISEEMPGWM